MGGLLYLYESKDDRRKIIVQVKGGDVKRGGVATLLGDVNKQKTAGGILLILEKPTKPIRDEAADAGRYESKLWHDKDYPKVQILTIEGLLNNTERVDAPTQMNPFGSSPNRIPGAQPRVASRELPWILRRKIVSQPQRGCITPAPSNL